MKMARYGYLPKQHREKLRQRVGELSEIIKGEYAYGSWGLNPEKAKRAWENASVLEEQLKTIRAIIGE